MKNFVFLSDVPAGVGVEGYLFPDTYRVFKDAQTQDIVQKMLENFDAKLTSEMRAAIGAQGKTVFDIVFFHYRPKYLEKKFPLNQEITISGKVTTFQNHFSICHPDFVGSVSSYQEWCGVLPVYPMTSKMSRLRIRHIIQKALETLPILPEWLSPSLLEKTKWPSWDQALKILHTSQDINLIEKAKERLVFDELLSQQIVLQLSRNRLNPGYVIPESKVLKKKLLETLPFELTEGQLQACKDIVHDMGRPYQMIRLIQGDVGSGKTIVALLAILSAIEAGYQAAFLAPTDILSRQQFNVIKNLTPDLCVCLLTGREQGKKREEILENLKKGTIHILVGTHALIQDPVTFYKLGLVVIDEQHRFGVEQRTSLICKGQNPDILTLTATPIPRTLLLTRYGDLDVSIIKDKPKGRKPPLTKVLPLSRLEEVIESLKRVLLKKAKIYWVCPLIEESATLDLAAAVERYNHLKQTFPGQVGLVHGKMKAKDKDAVMEAFAFGNLQVLVSTTVIEVGVDIPSATIMVIEQAERFGLAQLHQLRGRIGRGSELSTCLLVYGFPLSDIARKRLEVIRSSSDGFAIAEEDLNLRGGGDILGTQQSGLFPFKFSDFTSSDFTSFDHLLTSAHKEAFDMVKKDPFLTSSQGEAIRLLLRLFDKEEAIKYKKSG
ncbi:MAG: ATP-dependent DNA helicase RecG [Proteobacteria bacterium]|nr:ATP-dependent DNA helicase RecG [Pseudomonadota bacterium]